MKLTASIVTYNNEKEIGALLNSIISCQIENLKLYIIDNASSDNTVRIIRSQFIKYVDLVVLERNIGFGAGHNVALENIDSDYHIFINPDIRVNKNQIEMMMLFMEQNKDVVLLTPRILNLDGTEQYLPKRYPKIRYLISGSLESKWKIFYRWRDDYTMRNENIVEPLEIDFCSGCFMFCRTETLKQCGGFDERYFLHFEDVDLTREMKKYGKTIFNPHIQVTHEWKRENLKSLKIRLIAINSMVKYFLKWGF